MIYNYHFILPGRPIPKKTHRDKAAYVYRGRGVKPLYIPSKKFNPQSKEMNEVRGYLREQFPHAPLDLPLIMKMVCYFPIAKSWSKHIQQEARQGILQHFKRPDVSNLIKFYEDCMTGVIWEDDSLVVCTHAVKLYATVPRTEIWVRNFTREELLAKVKELTTEELRDGTTLQRESEITFAKKPKC